MKIKDVITALSKLDQEADLTIVIRQSNKKYGLPLKISQGSDLWTWVNGTYGGSITVSLPDGAYISKLPEHLKLV